MSAQGPTLYAALLDRAVLNPITAWDDAVEGVIQSIAPGLKEVGIEGMRRAYIAGVTDGFGQGVAAGYEKDDLSAAIAALKQISEYTGADNGATSQIAADALLEIDRA